MNIARNWLGTREPLICIVEGETGAARRALDHLEHADFEVRLIANRTHKLQLIEHFKPSVTIIETSDRRGLELCRAIRRIPSHAWMPVLLFSKNISEEECVRGLESGADDYISQMASGPELVARVRAALRRFARHALRSGDTFPSELLFHLLAGTSTSALRAGDLEIDTCSMRIWVRGHEIVVTALEFRLIFYLAHHQARVFTRDQLLDAVWGTQYQEGGSVNACIRRLRSKIEPDPKNPTYLKTIRGVGYLLDMGGVWGCQLPRAG
jgi:DNA-binding response OmpR family regulator